MERDDWGNRWSSGQIGFHQAKVTTSLTDFGDQVFGDLSGTVLVPLCGKTLDLVHLAEQFDSIIGVEYVEQAVQEFFAEQHTPPQVVAGPPVSYAADPYMLYAADFFTITAEHTGHIDAVLDRASLVALDFATRRRYADHLTSLLPSGARMLLVTFDYDQSEMSGPPFAVSDQEVSDLFSGGFTIDHLRTRDVLEDRMRERGLTAMTESAFALTRH